MSDDVTTTTEKTVIRVLCPTRFKTRSDPDSQSHWLIGSPFFPRFTILSTIKRLHTTTTVEEEADSLLSLLPKGLLVVGAWDFGGNDSPSHALSAAREIRSAMSGRVGDSKAARGVVGGGGEAARGVWEALIGAVGDGGGGGGGVRFFVEGSGGGSVEAVESVVYEENPERFVWERGCLVRCCTVPVRVPVFLPVHDSDVEERYLRAAEAVVAMFKDPQAVYMIERSSKSSYNVPLPVIVRGADLDFKTDISDFKLAREENVQDSDVKNLRCSHFCSKDTSAAKFISTESVDILQVSVLQNRLKKSTETKAPAAEYYPTSEDVRHLVVDFHLDVICYAARNLLLTDAVSKLVVPGLVDQLKIMNKTIVPKLLTEHPQHSPYHFYPPGLLHPITAIYELSYGEMEQKQVEVRRSLHLQLGLPSDRPLLRIANALDFSLKDDLAGKSRRKGPSLLKDVHLGIPSSGVPGGFTSLIQGSYEYFHYLHDGFDDSGWGCAYRSLQTIISWFRLQQYTSIDVPSHREIQESLVEIGDKDPSFVGSREWIGAIELSFVLDKLLGVSCKIMNVRSGAELPEKCRELALHFENQGTPVMIGGGVLAYTLLGVDYNKASGDCAFLILDPHYTGSEDHKKIVIGGWCGWKKAVDSKGRNFFLHDKFYNLLLPQRPNMV